MSYPLPFHHCRTTIKYGKSQKQGEPRTSTFYCLYMLHTHRRCVTRGMHTNDEEQHLKKKKFLSKILSIIDLTWLLSTSSWIISMVKIIQDMISFSFATTISPSTRHRVCFSRCCYGSMFAWTTTKKILDYVAFLFFALTSTSTAAMVVSSIT